jgi:2-polyprenyl-3-methyl-5-hydroxy-6-metoxy-1,4-benzoquinol methylase
MPDQAALAPSSANSGLPAELVDRWLRDGGAEAAADPLLLTLLESAVIPDSTAEAALTGLRRALLLRTEASAAPPDSAPPLLHALAHHCFVNEYVFVERADETAIVDRLRQRLEGILADGAPVPESTLAMVAAYRPLHRIARAEQLLSQDGSPAFRRLIDRQIREPLEEARLAAALPRLTPIDAASAEIHAQYEENPYPRWVKVSRPPPETLHDALRAMFPHVALPAGPAAPDILIAGCGTGQHAIETALRFRGSRVLAIDLSVASLAYAVRKTREHGLTTLDYGQADILQLGRAGRQFDVIEAVGVLHHMDDPIAGWRVLTALLRPGGFMKIGLYSARARAHIVRVRNAIAEAGYRATAEDIRRFRQALFEQSDADARRLAESPDFYSLSGCRDLLFNVREQHFSLPEIARTLDALQLVFVGFEIADEVKRRYRVDHPGDRALTDLGGWDAFESEHPETFRGMYQFWVRRR